MLSPQIIELEQKLRNCSLEDKEWLLEQLTKQLLSEGLKGENIPILGLSETDKAYVNQQALLFDEMHSSLLENYQGQWVVFEDGQVLDSDADYTILLDRISRQNKSIFLMRKVCP